MRIFTVLALNDDDGKVIVHRIKADHRFDAMEKAAAQTPEESRHQVQILGAIIAGNAPFYAASEDAGKAAYACDLMNEGETAE